MDTQLLSDLFARYRKGIAGAAGMTFLSFLAYLGPTWSVAVVAGVTAIAVIVIPNADEDGDGKVSITETFDWAIGKAAELAAAKVAPAAVDAALKAHPAIPYPATGEPVTEAITLRPIPAT